MAPELSLCAAWPSPWVSCLQFTFSRVGRRCPDRHSDQSDTSSRRRDQAAAVRPTHYKPPLSHLPGPAPHTRPGRAFCQRANSAGGPAKHMNSRGEQSWNGVRMVGVESEARVCSFGSGSTGEQRPHEPHDAAQYSKQIPPASTVSRRFLLKPGRYRMSGLDRV